MASKTDWDAVERDYRTGKFTTRELSVKHGPSHSLIARNAKKGGWTQDLAKAIKQATDAKLTNDLVNKEVHKGSQAVHKVIQVAAEVNAGVIRNHRLWLSDLADDMQTAKAKLMAMGDTVADIREAATFVQAVGNLATATKTLIEQERKAFGLDDGEPESHGLEAKFLAVLKTQ